MARGSEHAHTLLGVTGEHGPSARLFVHDEAPARSEGLPLVLVHGAGVDSSFYDGLATCMPARRTVRYDRRGCGQSTDALDGDWSLDAQARDLASVIRAAGGRADVVAHSLGAVVALRLLEREPRLFRRLVALEPPIFSGLDPADEVFGNIERARKALARHRSSTALYLTTQRESIGEAVVPYSARELEHRERNLQTSFSRETWAFDYAPDCDAIRGSGVPVLLCIGSQSDGTYHARNLDILCQGLDATPGVMPGGHNGVRDYSGEVAAAIRDWLR